MRHRIVVVTPAGRRAYLDLLKNYVLSDESISEWRLWDNCRDPRDREYIERLASNHAKISVIAPPSLIAEGKQGSNSAINRFYTLTREPDVFYIKMDDDIVWMPPGFAKTLYRQALAERPRFLWWSPIVINNAVCSWLLEHQGVLKTNAVLSAQASSVDGWKNPVFAEKLHLAFLEELRVSQLEKFSVAKNFDVSLSRFSINCIGFFGEDSEKLGNEFCPMDVDDEEWLSAVLPLKTERPGRICGSLVVSHFGFFTQEDHLLSTGLLDRYYDVLGINRVEDLPSRRKRTFREWCRRKVELKWFSGSRYVFIKIIKSLVTKNDVIEAIK